MNIAHAAAPGLPISLAEHAACASLCAARRIEPERLVIIHPGAPLPARHWPVERFVEVADALAGQGWQIAITGGATEIGLTSQVLGAMGAAALHLAGRTAPGVLAALLDQARLVVCNDTSISRLAAVLKTRSVVITSSRRTSGNDMRRRAPLEYACPWHVQAETVLALSLEQLDAGHARPAAPFTLHADGYSHAA